MESEIFSPQIISSVDGMGFIPQNGFPTVFKDLLSRSVLNGGKRLRPKLLLLISEHLQLPLSSLLVYAKVVEWIHAASLCHDDVVDQATTRRGAPSINMLRGNKLAVLAGDYLLAQAIRQLVDLQNPTILTFAAQTIQELALGESLQLEMRENSAYDQEGLLQVASCKTGSLMGLTTAIPYAFSGASDGLCQQALQFGRHLGIAFQQIDDCLDFASTSLKDQFQDLKNGQMNFVLYALSQRHAEVFNYLGEDHIPDHVISGDNLKEAISEVKLMAHNHLLQASKLLDKMPGGRSPQLLRLLYLLEKREK